MPTINDETLQERYEREALVDERIEARIAAAAQERKVDLEKITHDDCLMDVDESAWLRIVSKRGGCRCCISPPCAACTEPVTEEELQSVGYTYEDAAPTVQHLPADDTEGGAA